MHVIVRAEIKYAAFYTNLVVKQVVCWTHRLLFAVTARTNTVLTLL